MCGQRMESITDAWRFVISLVAVINGLGIVRLLASLTDYLKNNKTFNFKHYWVYTLLLVFQVLLHLLLWWSIIGLHQLGNINFLSYLYLLIGPTLLYLGTSFMVPDCDTESLNFRTEYYKIRKTCFSFLTAFFFWTIFVWPVFGHSFPITAPLLIIFFLIALTMRITDQPKIHATLIIANYAIYLIFIVLFSTHLGELGGWIAEH